jgi:hypothetical protein
MIQLFLTFWPATFQHLTYDYRALIGRTLGLVLSTTDKKVMPLVELLQVSLLGFMNPAILCSLAVY